MKISWKQRVKIFFFGRLTKVQLQQFLKGRDEHSVDVKVAQLLALLQKQGRFVDFMQHNIDHYSDDEIAAAARVVHQGCQKVLREYCRFDTIHSAQEGQLVSLEADMFDTREIVLSGNVANQRPLTGKLIHRGWKLVALNFPILTGDAKPEVIQPARIEIE